MNLEIPTYPSLNKKPSDVPARPVVKPVKLLPETGEKSTRPIRKKKNHDPRDVKYY